MLDRIRRHLTPSMAVAFIAFATASAGVGYAAATIDGRDVVNNSLSSADVKNASLQAKDLSAAARDSLGGGSGSTGPAGPAGQNGAPGAAAFSNVISRRKADAVPSTSGIINLFSETLSAGSYVIQSKADISGIPSGNSASCVIKLDGSEIDRTNAFSPALDGSSSDISHVPTLVNFAAFTLTQNRTILIQCEIEGGEGNATNGSLLITEVNSVTRSSDIPDPPG